MKLRLKTRSSNLCFDRSAGRPGSDPASRDSARPMAAEAPVVAQTTRANGDGWGPDIVRAVSGLGVIDPRAASPREIAELSMELYLRGWLRFEDSVLLGRQPELHPEFDRSVGALTGCPADPNRRRDQIQLWQQRLEFERRYNPSNHRLSQQLARIIDVLQRASDKASSRSGTAACGEMVA